MKTFTIILFSFLMLNACRNDEPESTEIAPNNVPSNVDANTLGVARQLTKALNNGNRDDAQNAFAQDAIFDSVGRIYRGSQDIMERFLVPEVINAGGRYVEVSITPDAAANNIVTIQYNFSTRNYSERFTYRYTIVNGRIQNVIGRYL